MILYDNDNNLVGVSKDTLSFLGYEDMDEFKTYASDVADLFVAKSGYVHKFNNFSWIDYVLHSGAASKNAIVKLKNGREIEAKIVIKEILLPASSKEFYYNVELKNLLHTSKDVKKDEIQPFTISEHKTKEVAPKPDEIGSDKELSKFKKETFVAKEESKEKNEKSQEDILPKFLVEDENVQEESLEENISNTDTLLKFPEEEKEDVSLEFCADNKKEDELLEHSKEDKDEESPVAFGLKDENILEPQSSFAKKEEGFNAEVDVIKEKDEGFKVRADKKDDPVFFSGSSMDENIGFGLKVEEEDEFLKAHALPTKKDEPKIKFNVQKSVEFLGISEGDIRNYVKEYLAYADELDTKLAEYIKNNDIIHTRQIAIQLKSLAEVLCIDDLSASLSCLCEKCDDEGEEMYDEYKKDLENFKRTEI